MFGFQFYGVPLNPELNPPPQKWWVESFDYYQVFPLAEEKTYGPFFRIGGESFEPIIGVSTDEFSESQCFYSLTLPKDSEEARRILKLFPSNPAKFAFKFFITVPRICNNAQLYIGPIRGGEAFQVGINGTVEQIIREEIRQGKIYRYKLED